MGLGTTGVAGCCDAFVDLATGVLVDVFALAASFLSVTFDVSL